MNKENNLTVGPNTAKLLWALRSIETARNNYYLAMEELRGNVEDLTDHVTPEENTVFDNARDLIENKIGDAIRFWANKEVAIGEI